MVFETLCFQRLCGEEMTVSKSGVSGRKKDRIAEIANTFEWLITAFVLAFVFRAFVMEAFRIPTGSMADTLMGAHFRLRCPQCGYKYRYGLGNFRVSRDTIPRGALPFRRSRCPSCGFYQPTGGRMPISNGDRILVLKCFYQFFEPKQWDVIVFKNPLNPIENYIKRLVGRPGEKVEIIDGDVYINDQISRKPTKVQQKLWMPVYDNDYQPIRPDEPAFNGHKWSRPFHNSNGSKWKVDETNAAVFVLDSAAQQISTLSYDTSLGNDFRATYAYDGVGDYRYLPYCSDLMVRFWVKSSDLTGDIGISLSKYGRTYRGWYDYGGQMNIAVESEDGEKVLASGYAAEPMRGKHVPMRFANLDHRLVLEFGDEKLEYDMGREPNAAGPRRTKIKPQVKIFGAGKLELLHIAIFRDIHYTSRNPQLNDRGRATEGNPLQLGEDEFFVLGDNSPRSEDGRWWSRKGRGNNGKKYRYGVVPREYLVGKALFVYWPAGFRPFARSRYAVVPNIGEMRFIYGGSDETF